MEKFEQILSELYHGNIKPSEKKIESEEYKKITKENLEITNKILENSDSLIKKLFNEYIENESILNSIDAENQFSSGFSLAIKLILNSLK